MPTNRDTDEAQLEKGQLLPITSESRESELLPLAPPSNRLDADVLALLAGVHKFTVVSGPELTRRDNSIDNSYRIYDTVSGKQLFFAQEHSHGGDCCGPSRPSHSFVLEFKAHTGAAALALEPPEPPLSHAAAAALPREHLRAELAARSLPTEGKRAALAERLMDALTAEAQAHRAATAAAERAERLERLADPRRAAQREAARWADVSAAMTLTREGTDHAPCGGGGGCCHGFVCGDRCRDQATLYAGGPPAEAEVGAPRNGFCASRAIALTAQPRWGGGATPTLNVMQRCEEPANPPECAADGGARSAPPRDGAPDRAPWAPLAKVEGPSLLLGGCCRGLSEQTFTVSAMPDATQLHARIQPCSAGGVSALLLGGGGAAALLAACHANPCCLLPAVACAGALGAAAEQHAAPCCVVGGPALPPIATIAKRVPPDAARALAEAVGRADTFTLELDPSAGLDPQQKAALLGSLVFADYVWFEEDANCHGVRLSCCGCMCPCAIPLSERM